MRKRVNKIVFTIDTTILILISIFILIAVTNNNKISVDNVESMKKTHLNIGDIVKTKGYYSKGDRGEATYEIMTYDDFYNSLPTDIKAVSYRNDKLGLGNPNWSKTPVDEYGNHTLNNGLVAKIINDDIITPEQWGCIGDGISDNTEQLIHLFAFTKSGYIKFYKDATYLMKSRTYNRLGKLALEGNLDDEVIDPEAYKNNEYIWSMCGYYTAGAAHGKPVMANIEGVTLDGNNCNIKIAEDDFSNNTSDFGTFQFSGIIKNLEIKNFNFDNSGLSQVKDNTRTTNHTLVYIPGDINAVQLENGTGDIKPKILNRDKKREFSNVNIHNNTFKDNGTGVNTNDGGGDFILLINPEVSHDVYIENNTFENWGRWVFAVDLGGNGECLESYKFNNNTCIQDENNKLESGQYRGLGWIDFESKKCWKNLEVKGNYVEGLNSFAINGANEINENITISDNTIKRIDRDYKSAYPYSFEFYGVQMKNLKFEGNKIEAGGNFKFGYTLNNISIKNNQLNSPIQLNGLYGDITIENNIKEDSGALIQLLGLEIPTYIDSSQKLKCNFNFSNNIGGIEGDRGQEAMFFDPNNPGKYKYIDITIEGNKAKLFNIVAWDDEDFIFDPNQVIDNSTFAVRGAKFINPTYTKGVNNPVVGGGCYERDDIVINNIDECTKIDDGYYKNIDISNKLQLKCTKTGYLPNGGEFLLCKADKKFTPKLEVGKNDYVYNDGKLYIACSDGILGEKLNHSNGSELCGEVKMLYLTNLAEIN